MWSRVVWGTEVMTTDWGTLLVSNATTTTDWGTNLWPEEHPQTMFLCLNVKSRKVMSSNDGIFDQGKNRLPPTTLVREQWWTFEHEVVIRISSVSDAYSSPFSAEATHRSDRWRPSIKQESTREAAPQYPNTLLVFWRSIVSRPIEPRSAEQNKS
jgi:hypothetical protein